MGTKKRSTPVSALNGIHPRGEKLNTHAQRYTHKDVYHSEVSSCENGDSVLCWMLPGRPLSVTNSSQRPPLQRTAPVSRGCNSPPAKAEMISFFFFLAEMISIGQLIYALEPTSFLSNFLCPVLLLSLPFS